MKKKSKKTKSKSYKTKNGNWKVYPEGATTEELLDDMEVDYQEEGLDDLGESEIEDKKEKRTRETKGKEPAVIPNFLEEDEIEEIPEEKKKSNPNGANQYFFDPRQNLCWKYYIDPKSETFSNAYQSALKANYEDETAKQITMTKWFSEKTRRMNMLSRAEKVLENTLKTTHIRKKIGMFGPIVDPVKKEYVYEIDPATLAIKNKVAMFVAETQGKDSGYSKRTELTGKDGKDLPTPILGGLPPEPEVPKPEEKKEETVEVIVDPTPPEEIPTPPGSILGGIIPEN